MLVVMISLGNLVSNYARIEFCSCPMKFMIDIGL